MAEVKAFKALRFTIKGGDISKNVCPPYDIVSEKQRENYINESAFNIIRLEKPVGDAAYDEAKGLYLDWRSKDVLSLDKKEGIYVYEEEFSIGGETKRIRGVFARVRLEEFSKGVVLPHEETLSKAKQDRFELMCATGCNFSPVYSLYSDENRVISSKISQCSAGKPEIEFTAEDGVVQRLWKIENPDDIRYIENAFTDKQLFIADGHHRYETALRYRNKLREDGVIADEAHAANFIMMTLVDMQNDGLVVFPTHRIVKGVSGFDARKFLNKADKYFEVSEIDGCDAEKALAQKDTAKAFVMCAPEDKYYLLKLKSDKDAEQRVRDMNPGKTKAYTELDVTVLHSLLLEDILGIDKENMARQINLGYTRDAFEAKELVRAGKANCAFLIRPTLVSQIRDAALAGEKMPQKSTYFYPKLITGLVMNELLSPEKI